MPLERVTPTSTPERILIYGDPKTGKTRLSTSLPETFGDIIYFAADPGSESLASVLESHRQRVAQVVKSRGPDPDKDAFEFALTDWRKEFPKAGTLVWDTLTATSLDILNHLADSGAFSEKKHIAIGSTANPQNIPMMGDYMAAQNRISRLLDFLFKQPLHIIVICHATYDETRNGESPEFGPATSGKATVRTLPGRFDTVLHAARRILPSQKPGGPAESRYSVYTERHGIWSAGVRSSLLTNPIPVVETEPDPISFWNTFLTKFRGASK